MPADLSTLFGRATPQTGYCCWKAGRRNWLQWNDPGDSARKQLENTQGEMRSWELFARFARQPSSAWEKPARYEAWKWMPSGDDVWGCTRAGLVAFPGDIAQLKARLIADLTASHDYSQGEYGS
ncbi:MAG: hypothetical protein ACRDGT_00325 [Candidatus Limnocylindria bacterium]